MSFIEDGRLSLQLPRHSNCPLVQVKIEPAQIRNPEFIP
jgi:hypothetical protein